MMENCLLNTLLKKRGEMIFLERENLMDCAVNEKFIPKKMIFNKKQMKFY